MPRRKIYAESQCQAAHEDARATIADLQARVAQLREDKSSPLEQLEAA